MRYRWMYSMTGLPGWMRFGWSPGWGWRGGPGPAAWYAQPAPWWGVSAPIDELAFWKNQQTWLRNQLAWVEKRIAELERTSHGDEAS